MKLTVWTYEGPPHVGAMRVATGMKGLHYVLHAPQGDTYADLLFTMIERRDHRPPVTYTTFQARDLGSDTAGLFKQSCQDAYARFKPEAIIVGASCTAELIQDDPGGLAETMGLPIPVIPLELPSYQRKENFGADETFFQIVRHLAKPMAKTERVSCNIIVPTALGFRHRDDVQEITNLLYELGIEVNVTAPMGATPADIARMGQAHFNVLLYPETGEQAARFSDRTFDQPYTKIIPIGAGATHDFIAEVRTLSGSKAEIDTDRLRQSWWSRSVDSTYLTGKRVFIFGDGTHVLTAARLARDRGHALHVRVESVPAPLGLREIAQPLQCARELAERLRDRIVERLSHPQTHRARRTTHAVREHLEEPLARTVRVRDAPLRPCHARAVGASKAIELMADGSTFDYDEAERLGLVNGQIDADADEAFLDAVARGIDPPVTGEQGVEALEVAAKIVASLRESLDRAGESDVIAP